MTPALALAPKLLAIEEVGVWAVFEVAVWLYAVRYLL